MFGFEKLDVWKKSIEFADRVYQLTATFPADERFDLVSQLRRATVSISSNIAEGSCRSSRKDFARFVEVAYGSLMETVSQMHIAHRQKMTTESQLHEFCSLAEQLAKMLSGLKSSLDT